MGRHAPLSLSLNSRRVREEPHELFASLISKFFGPFACPLQRGKRIKFKRVLLETVYRRFCLMV